MASNEAKSTTVSCTTEERDVPVQRMGTGFFDPFFLGESDSDITSSMVRMRRQMQEMERQMERMFEHFFRLEPTSASRMRSATGRIPHWWDDEGQDLLGWRRGHRSLWDADLALPSSSAAAPTSPIHDDAYRPMLRQTSHDHSTDLIPAGGTSFPSEGRVGQFGAPVVIDQAGGRKLRMRFDVRQFKPEEITVKTHDNKVMVRAVHKEESDSNQVFCEYQRMFTMPPEVKPDTLTSALSPEGVLTLEAPMPAAIEAPKDTVIPITHE